MPFRKLFLNRWSALLWAGGILWTAVDVAGFAPAPATAPTTDNQVDATDIAVNADDLATLATVMKGD